MRLPDDLGLRVAFWSWGYDGGIAANRWPAVVIFDEIAALLSDHDTEP